MIGTTLPLTAYADEPENTENTENEDGNTPDTTACAFVVTGGTEETDYAYADGVLTIKTAMPLTIANQDPGTATSDCIFIEADVSADITLAGVNIASASGAPIEIADNSTGNVTITLADDSKNYLKNTSNSNSGSAALQKNGVYSEGLGKLLIRCAHSDRDYDADGGHECIDTCGVLETTTEWGSGAAGIGGAGKQSAANIYITGGKIKTVAEGLGAGIGSGYIGSGNASHIYISGGVIDASSERGGAGIGGGNESPASDIYVSGGRISASTTNGAGIGAGQCYSATRIYISGGIIQAESTQKGTGIGGGSDTENGRVSEIHISGGVIDASSERGGAGIGSGVGRGYADITLVGGSVNATVSDPAKDASGNEIYMLKVENPSGSDVIVDGSSYRRHSTDDPNVYVWLTEGSHTVNGVAANYAAGSGRLKYAPQENDFTYTIPKDITYNATPQPATVTLKAGLPYSGSNAFAKYYYADGENGTKDAPVNAGTYTVKACMDETEDHIAVEYEVGTFTIAPAIPALTWNETSKDVYYTGSRVDESQLSGALTVGLLGKDTYSGEISYSYRAVKDGKSAGDFSEGLPTDPGTYEIKAAIPANGNYTAAQTTDTMTLTIRYLDGAGIPDATVTHIADGWCPANGSLQAPDGYQISAAPDGTYEETCAYALDEKQDTITYYLQKTDTKEIAQKSMTIRVDRTAPGWKGDNTGIQIRSKWWNSLLSSLTFGFYKGDQIDVSVKANDDQSGVAAYYYYVDRVDQSGSTAVKTEDELDQCLFQRVAAGADQSDAVTLLSLSDDGRYVVYAYAADAVGNRSAYICSDGVVLDRVAPTLTVKAAPSKEQQTLRDTTAEISFNGSEAGTYFYIIKEAVEAAAPTTMDDFATKTSGADVDSWQATSGVSTGKLTAGENRIKLDKLAPNTAHVLYLAAVDEAGNASVANAGDIVSVSFTTLKTIPYVETAPVLSGTYGQKLSEMKLDDENAKVVASQGSEDKISGTWSIQSEDASQIPGVAATDTYTLIFTPDAGSAYEPVNCEVTPQVAKKPVTVVIADAERSYGEESSKFTWTLAEGSAYVGNDSATDLGIQLSTAATAQSDVGEYAITGVSDSVKYDVTFSGAHEDGKSGVLKVTQAENAFTTALSCAGYVYEKGRTPEPAAIAKYGTVTYKYTTIGTDGTIPADAVYTTDVPVNVGKYAVKAYVDRTDNYKGLESDAVPFMITKAAHPSNMPGSTMSAAYSQAKVSAVPLPSGWTWSDVDQDKELSVGVAVTAGAIYTAQDKANYEQTELTITITRLAQVTPGSSGGSGGGGGTGGAVAPGKTDDSGKEDTPDPTPDTPTDQPMPQPSGTKVKDASGASYQVTGTGGKNPTVRYTAPKSKTGKTVKIPATVKINGVSYKVTSIAANAFKNNKKVQKVEIGKNIVSIGKKAFANCKNLKTITISSMNLTDETISEDAFSGISADVTIKVPKSKYKEYKKLLRKKGLSKKVRIKKY